MNVGSAMLLGECPLKPQNKMEHLGIFAVLLSGAWGKGIVVLNALQSNSFTYKDTHEIEGKHKLLQYQVKVRLEQYSLLLQTSISS